MATPTWDQELARSLDVPVHRLWSLLRTTARFTLAQVGERLHVTRQAVSAWETGVKIPTEAHRRQMLALYAQARPKLEQAAARR